MDSHLSQRNSPVGKIPWGNLREKKKEKIMLQLKYTENLLYLIYNVSLRRACKSVQGAQYRNHEDAGRVVLKKVKSLSFH